MPDSTSHDPDRPAPPSVAEIAALTARLRQLSTAGARADADERAAFLADKEALLDRIAATERAADARPRHDDRRPDGREDEQSRRDLLNQWSADDRASDEMAHVVADDVSRDVTSYSPEETS